MGEYVTAEEWDELRAAAVALLKRYVDLAESGDCGNWDPEKEPEVVAMREALGNDGDSDCPAEVEDHDDIA